MLRTIPLVLALCCAGCTDDDQALATPDPDPDPPAPACDVGVELSGVFSAPADTQIPDTVTIGLLQFDEEALDKPMIVGAVHELTSNGAVRWTLCLPDEPADSWFTETDDVAAFVVGAWDDRVQDGVPGAGETLIGAEFTLIAYVRGQVDQELSALGGGAGWNVIGLDLTGESDGPTWAETFDEGYTTYDIEANLAPHTYASLAVTLEPSSDGAATVGLLAMHEMFGINRPKNATVAATNATGESSVELTGFEQAPPSSHLIDDLDDDMLAVALYAGIAFVDANHNWQLDRDEELLAASFTEADQISVFYVQPRHFYASLIMQQKGVVAGWSIGELTDEEWPSLMPWADGLHLGPVD